MRLSMSVMHHVVSGKVWRGEREESTAWIIVPYEDGLQQIELRVSQVDITLHTHTHTHYCIVGDASLRGPMKSKAKS